MLHRITDQLWHVQHQFRANGLAISTRMSVVQLPGSRLWLHSPVPINAALRAQLRELGEVSYIVAPSKTHHLFLADGAAAFPQAQQFGAPGLQAKRPELASLHELPEAATAPWAPELDWTLFEGIPYANETVWFHRPSASLILTDLLQCWQGELGWPARLYAHLTGVHRQLAAPRTVRALVRDRAAVRRSTERLLAWPFERVLMAHDAVIDKDAHARVAQALRSLC
ncbi:DUF4336 domain-containing protein [Paucibacter soli]|uniref:DUF4336 domain-containing protein n=1 Tax=Paucibacter soli TaxID=3133433 RepID=UPI0030A44B16